MKIEVYSYRRAHRCACCSSGTLCRDRGALMCNTVVKCSENDVDTLDKWNFTQHSNCSFRSVLLSPSIFKALGFCSYGPSHTKQSKSLQYVVQWQ